MTDSTLRDTVRIAKALANPARLRLLALLEDGELCLCQLTEIVGLAPSTVSAHLAELRRSGMIDERRDGKWRYVSLSRNPQTRPWIVLALEGLGSSQSRLADAELAGELREIGAETLCKIGLDAARQRNQK